MLVMVPLGLRLGASSSRSVARLVPACKHGRWIRIRQFHQRKGLPYPVEQGLGEFLSADALKIIAEDYQGGLLERLNDQVRGASKPVVSRTCVLYSYRNCTGEQKCCPDGD